MPCNLCTAYVYACAYCGETTSIPQLKEENAALRAEVERCAAEKKTWDKVVEDYERQLAECNATDISKLRAEVERMEEHCVTRDQQLAEAVEVLRDLACARKMVSECIEDAHALLARLEVRP